MKRLVLLLVLAFPLVANAQDRLYADEFPLGDVTLLDGPLKHARDLNVQTLLLYDSPAYLSGWPT